MKIPGCENGKQIIKKIMWKLLGYNNYTKLLFRIRLSYSLNITNPTSFTEKMQWIKFFGNLEKYSKYVDKFDVRDFIEKTIGKEYLIPIIGVYNKVDEINFDALPNSFIIKGTHGCGFNLIVKNKDLLMLSKVKKTLKKWLKTSYYKITGEKNYKQLNRRIIIEELINDPSGDLKDYKFFCFDGEPILIQVDSGRHTNHSVDYYNLQWELLPLKIEFKNSPDKIEKPSKLNEMIEICRKLSKQFPFVRIDLYYTNNQIYFGELTFTPANGMTKFNPVDFDFELGKFLRLELY